ncbi:MATE family efflux transporter [Gymnodinialimonas sp. 2305UL16-5]|uniref:MATE family efflux transporter n=1 Tax=Gymnodinialimonas mytili TaxID=3126503 RepID=UPI00309D1F8B
MTERNVQSDIPPTRAIFGLAWPMAVKAVMLHGIVVIDAYLVAGFGETALAALGVAGAIAGLVLGVLFAFSSATQIRVAQAHGSGDPSFLKSALVAGLIVNLGACCLGFVFLALTAGPLIDSFAHDANVAADARRYLAVFSAVILAEAIGQCISSYFNGIGNTKLPLYSYAVALPVNIAASLMFIYGYLGAPAMGVVGAAVGSVIATLLQVGILLVSLRALAGDNLRVTGWRNGTFAATLLRHLQFSWPIAATFISAALANNVCRLLYARMPLTDFAAMTLITPWIMVVGTIGMSWAQATGIYVAQLLGKHVDGPAMDQFLSRAWRGAFWAAALVALIYALICLISSKLYADLHPDTTAAILSFLPILLLLPFPKGSNAICGNTLRAAGDTLYVMHIFVWSQWLFRVPATAVLVLYLDVPAIWVLSLLLLEELIKLPAFHARLFKGDWKTRDVAV